MNVLPPSGLEILQWAQVFSLHPLDLCNHLRLPEKRRPIRNFWKLSKVLHFSQKLLSNHMLWSLVHPESTNRSLLAIVPMRRRWYFDRHRSHVVQHVSKVSTTISILLPQVWNLIVIFIIRFSFSLFLGSFLILIANISGMPNRYKCNFHQRADSYKKRHNLLKKHFARKYKQEINCWDADL